MSIKTELFQPVLDWLEAGAPHDRNIGFNMGQFIEPDAPDFKDDDCGTACCIAGAIVQFNELPGYGQTDAIAEIFQLGEFPGMTKDQSLRLFFAADRLKEPNEHGKVYPNTGALLGQEGLYGVTAEDAARVLGVFLETGEVVWS